MKLYLLERTNYTNGTFGYLVVAKDSKQARKLAVEVAQPTEEDFFRNKSGSSIRQIGVTENRVAVGSVISILAP